MNPEQTITTPASEWSHDTLAALENKGRSGLYDEPRTSTTDDLSKRSGREQAAAQLLARTQAQSQTVDQELAQTAIPVVPTRPVVVQEPTPGLHSTAAGVPHAVPISATAQTGGFTEPATGVSGIAVVAAPTGPPPAQTLVTAVPGVVELKTVPDLSAQPAAPSVEQLPSHNPFNPEHTPGFLTSEQRTMTGATTPGNELPGGWGAVLKTQGAAALPHTESTLSEDVTTALHEVGRTAFGILPQSLVERISNQHQPGQPATTVGAQLPSVADVRETTGNAATSVGNTAANVGSQVYETTANAGQVVGNTAANVGSQVYETTANAGSVVGNTAANVGSTVYETTANAGQAVGKTAANVGSTLYETTANAGAVVGNTAANVGSTVYETTANATTAVRDTTTHAAETLAQTGQGLVEQAREMLGSLHLPGFAGAQHGGSTVRSETEGTRSVAAPQAHQESVVDQAKNIAQELLGKTQSKAEEAYNAVRGESTTATGPHATGNAQSWRGTLEGYGERAATQVAEFGGHSVNPNVHNTAHTSLPSEETTGAHPGEHSEGVGALPGSKFATGVAILPDERALQAGQGDENVHASAGRGIPQTRTLASEQSGSDVKNATSSGIGSGQVGGSATGAHEGYAPSGPAIGLSGNQQTSSSHHHGHEHGDETYEGSHRSLTEIIKAGANKHDHPSTGGSAVHSSSREGYAPSGPVADLSGHSSTETSQGAGVADVTRVSGDRAQTGSYELGGLAGASSSLGKTHDLSTSSAREDSTGGAHTLSASTGITRPEGSSNAGYTRPEDSSSTGFTRGETASNTGSTHPSTTGFSSSTTTTTTHAAGAGSGPLYDLAPPLGAMVGSTPLSSHIQTNQSHNPVLPGNIPPALPREPVQVAAPSETTTGASAAALEHTGARFSTDSTRETKDSGVTTPGSTLGSETAHTTAINPALDAVRFHAPKPDRVDSHASTTAIIHGKEGNLHHEKQLSAGSSLAAVTEKDLPKTPQTTTGNVGQSTPTAHSTSTNTATRAPGTETGAVGGKDQTTANSEPHKTVKEEFAAVGHGTLDKPASSVAAQEAPKTDSSATVGHGQGIAPGAGGTHVPSQHARTDSAGSGGSKRSFLDKIKSKIHHNKH